MRADSISISSTMTAIILAAVLIRTERILQVSLPEGDRLSQARNQYFPQQEILANKQLRWWWNNDHQAIYDNGDGTGFSPHGPTTEWTPNSKSIITLEYGFAACDKSTNQPNVFFDPKSTESFTAYWSIWDPANELGYLPRRDDTIQALALRGGLRILECRREQRERRRAADA